MIPVIDLKVQHEALAAEIMEVLSGIVAAGAFVGGPQLEAFEREWAAFCGADHAIGVGSGTDAVRFALMGTGVGAGDEVVTVPFTFVATLEAILQAGAKPILVDVDPGTYTLDPGRLEAAITPKTRALLPVHLYGQPADMEALQQIADRRGLLLLEDASQAHGATCRGRTAGSLGRAAAFSFYPAKNMGACGEAGAVTTSDPEVARKVRMLREHGQSSKNAHDFPGFNAKMDAIQAAVLRIKLKRLPQWNEARRAVASVYDRLLADVPGLILPRQAGFARSVYHLYVVRTARRDELQEHLKAHGIATGVHYPVPLHFQKAFAYLGYSRGDFPVSEKLAEEVLSLPIYPELPLDSVEYICSRVRDFMA